MKKIHYFSELFTSLLSGEGLPNEVANPSCLCPEADAVSAPAEPPAAQALTVPAFEIQKTNVGATVTFFFLQVSIVGMDQRFCNSSRQALQ